MPAFALKSLSCIEKRWIGGFEQGKSRAIFLDRVPWVKLDTS
jgi:hypothetical protein